ncbi:ribosome biogenesis GTPase Der [Desulfobacterium sp. N47]|uniref:GTPase Der n=1 Tax=uncultured Desulfobacterium sp. TaxID=201089 RepID=E1Y8X6_9BACT|nr:GTP-binding protein engA [uncultured Desulfobacterium sp.]
MKPIITIVGRPNVGKSTFFNRVTRSKDAIVDDFPGVTRDCIHRDAVWNDVEFTLVDTGGFAYGDEDDINSKVRMQVKQSIDDADAIIMMLDGKSGVSPFDSDIVQLLRSVSKPVFYVVNKIDGDEKEINLYEFYSLGIERIYSLSSEHGYGVGSFLDDLVSIFPKADSGQYQDIIKVAVIGRPNVGKSSLINRILGKDRHIVSDVPGTTRDAVDSLCEIKGKQYLIIDTAGIRRKSKVSKKIEKFSIIKALKSLDRCDIALIIIDASEGITDQDISIAGYAYERECGCIFLLNKWDTVEKGDKIKKKFIEQLKYEAKYLNYAPAMTISAKTGLGVAKIFDLVDEVYKQYEFRIGTGELNRILESAVTKTEPSLYKGRRIKFYYTTQVSIKPPTFVFFVNYADALHFSYKRYLVNQIRAGAGLDKTPIKLVFKKRDGDRHKKK